MHPFLPTEILAEFESAATRRTAESEAAEGGTRLHFELQHERERLHLLTLFPREKTYQQERSRGQLQTTGVAKTEGRGSEGGD